MSLQSNNSAKECCWKHRWGARHYWKLAHEGEGDRIGKMIDSLSITPESRVLDIGAGPGVLAIPLAKRVAHVTAVEPLEAMLGVLRDQMATDRIDNITRVQKTWEEVDVQIDLAPPYDVVLAAFALNMPNLKDCIHKMVNASSRYIYLFWFAGEQGWERHYKALFPGLYGVTYQPFPKSDVLLEVLHQMGIQPHVAFFNYRRVTRFSCLEEAMDHFRPRYQIITDRQESVLSNYLQQSLERQNGFLILGCECHCARIWWEKGISDK
jgi:SAM-dependent methyltransferase